MPYSAINWNHIQDQLDKTTWEKLTEQFWLDTRVPISKDLKQWRELKPEERRLFNSVFAGLTLLDTLQSQDGISALKADIVTQAEEAVLNNIEFMESVHAKSYSSIFETLNTPSEIASVFTWIENNEHLQAKAARINDIYQNGTPLQKKIASVFLETFMFYSGFYTPVYYLGHNKMVNVAEVIKLIIRDESVHGQYIGYKFQIAFNKLDDAQREDIKSWMYDLLFELYQIEEAYTHDLYDDLGWSDDVLTFLRYNANKALMNLGQEPLFPDGAEDVNPVIMNGISTSTANHDFFSGIGNGYLLGQVEQMDDDDYLVGID